MIFAVRPHGNLSSAPAVRTGWHSNWTWQPVPLAQEPGPSRPRCPQGDGIRWRARNDRTRTQLQAKAPPRRRPKNDPQSALLTGLLIDPHGRQMVPTYATKRSRRYAAHETRKDLAAPGDASSTRFQQGALDRHVMENLNQLLGDEHGLRRLSCLTQANALRDMFAAATGLIHRLAIRRERKQALRSLLAAIRIKTDRIEVVLKPSALGLTDAPCWTWVIPCIARKPSRVARLRIDAASADNPSCPAIVALLAAAAEPRDCVQGSPGLASTRLPAIRGGAQSNSPSPCVSASSSKRSSTGRKIGCRTAGNGSMPICL